MNNLKEHETIYNLTGTNNYLLEFRSEMIDLPQEYKTNQKTKNGISLGNDSNTIVLWAINTKYPKMI